MFDIFYMGDNVQLAEDLPFAKQINSVDEIKPNTKMFWLVEPNIEIVDTDVFNFRPPSHDIVYEHVWKWNSTNYGGVRLLPKKENKGVKEVNQIVCKKTFDILFTTDTPDDYFEDHPYASHVWCVDPEYKISDDINWAPGNFEPDYIHVFHLRGQLDHKYPGEAGGVKLYPRHWGRAPMKYHAYIDAAKTYPVLFVEDPEDYSQRDIYDDDYVWLIDQEHKINLNSLTWVPSVFEDSLIHSFRMPHQLTEKTWSFYHSKADPNLGGIRLVPREWRKAFDLIEGGIVIHKECPITDVVYDVFYIGEKITDDVLNKYAGRSQTEWFWLIDKGYDFNGELRYVPHSGEREYIHVFNITGYLEEKYPTEAAEKYFSTTPQSVGGIWLVNRNFDYTKWKLHTDEVPVRYDVFYTDDMSDYARPAKLSSTEMFWLVDNSANIDSLNWLPKQRHFKTISKFDETLKLVPVDYEDASTVSQFQLQMTRSDTEYERFGSIAAGAENSKHAWFWVIQPNVDMLPDFAYDFIPDEWDEGKIHVWQKLNPVTNRQYDYDGVQLVPKVLSQEKNKTRPKYVKQPACVQKPFPVYYLDADTSIDKQLREFDADANNDCYWVIDPYVELADDFDFSFYPTQWDVRNVHVFQTDIGSYRNVRLIPAGTFGKDSKYTAEDLEHNRFDDLKLINTVASKQIIWPVIELAEHDKDSFADALYEAKQSGFAYAWSVDADVDVTESVIEQGYQPSVNAADKVHLWQRVKPNSTTIHSYGGLRLWPTDRDYSTLTTAQLRLNKIKGVQYVKEVGSTYKPYDTVFISFNDEYADKKFDALAKRVPGIKHIKDVQGIFNAHQAGAKAVDSTMFWVVDSDAEVVEDFEFNYIPDVYDQETVHVWKSINPITGDDYGYGGVKLFNRQQVLDATNWGLDFTTGLSKSFKLVEEVSNVTKFNTSPLATWRSAFRECVKLAVKPDAESKARLATWLAASESDATYAQYAADGAKAGSEYALQYKSKPMRLARINDFKWLSDRFDEYYA